MWSVLKEITRLANIANHHKKGLWKRFKIILKVLIKRLHVDETFSRSIFNYELQKITAWFLMAVCTKFRYMYLINCTETICSIWTCRKQGSCTAKNLSCSSIQSVTNSSLQLVRLGSQVISLHSQHSPNLDFKRFHLWESSRLYSFKQA